MNLLDTDVLVDCLRGTIPAQKWLKPVAAQSFAVPAVAAMELVMGCHDRADLGRIQRFLAAFEVVWPEPSEYDDFTQRLHADLQQKGVRCWFAPEDLKIGDRFRTRIDDSIRVYDKLLIGELDPQPVGGRRG